MIDEDELPTSRLERAHMMEGILIAAATGGSGDGRVYELLRREFMSDTAIRELLPSFVRTYRTLDAFWPYIKYEASTYAERRQIIGVAFTPLIEHLEGQQGAPGDQTASAVLETFDPEGVHKVWEKALSRRATDPEGAITVARTLLETVTKRILDDLEPVREGAERG